jgi:hypothetical protein
VKKKEKGGYSFTFDPIHFLSFLPANLLGHQVQGILFFHLDAFMLSEALSNMESNKSLNIVGNSNEGRS